MPGNLPNPTVSPSYPGDVHNKMRAFARSRGILKSDGIISRVRPDGVFHQVEPFPPYDQGAADPSEPGSPIKRAQVLAIFGDYYSVRLVELGNIVRVAKNFKIRNSILTETIQMGNITLVFTYTYIDFMKRQARTTLPDTTVYTETQVIVPRMLTGDYIRVFQPSDGPGLADATIVWEDLNTDGRAWTKEYQN